MAQADSVCPICAASFSWPAWNVETTMENSAYWQLKRHMDAEHPGEMFVCPRQSESFQRANDAPQAFWRDGGKCSYCGSLSPELFFEAVERGDKIDPTDKNYKAYVHRPNPNVGKPRVFMTESGPLRDPRTGQISEKLKGREPTPEELETGSYHIETYGPDGPTTFDKFYFQHLDAAGQDRFIELFNAKKFNLGEPGHFYRLPFFCVVRPDP